MMWLLLVPLSLLAAAFVIWPLLSRRGTAGGEQDRHDEAVRALYRQRLGELPGEAQRAGHDAQTSRQIEDELGAVLLTEMDPREHAAAAAPVKTAMPTGMLVGLALAIPVAAFVLYYTISDPGVVELRGAEQVMSLDAQTQRTQLEDWQQVLRRRVQQADDDHSSWYLLGHTELKLGNFSSAAQAFASTHALVDDDLSVRVYWLQARYLAAGGNLDTVSRKLADELLADNPNMPVVLEMLAIDAYNSGRAGETITLLNRAISGSRDPAQQASFAVAIRQVRSAMQDPPPGVQVEASAAVSVPHNATLFVLARPVGGGMPYAVVKRPAALLPLTVQLDDLVSMSPSRPLSSAEEFEVVVRLSRKGTAMAAPDDWQWVSPAQSLSSAAAPGSIPALRAELTPPT